MIKKSIKPLIYYPLAIIASVVALFLYKGIEKTFQHGLPTYILFYPTITLVALFWGFGPGIVAVVTSAILAQLYIMTPLEALEGVPQNLNLAFEYLAAKPINLVTMTLFLGMGVLLCVLMRFYRQTKERLKEYEQRMDAKEIGKPVAINLQSTIIIYIGFILAVIIFVSSVYINNYNLSNTLQVDNNYLQLQEKNEKLNQVLSLLKDAETGQRGYIITGDAKYLAPYLDSRNQIEKLIKKLEVEKVNALNQLIPLIKAKFQELQKSIDLRNYWGADAAQKEIATDRGKKLMDELRKIIYTINLNDKYYLKNLFKEKEMLITRTRSSLAAGAILSFLLLVSVFLFLILENRRRLKYEVELDAYRINLEKLVESQTRELHLANEKLESKINKLKEQENILRISEEKFRILFEQAAVGIKRVDRTGKFLEANNKYCEILGLSKEELLNLSIEDVTFPEDLPFEKDQIERLLSKEIDSFILEKRIIRKDGSLRWIKVTSSIPYNHLGHEWLVYIVEDITKRKEAEEALMLTQKSLQESAQELGRSNRDLEQFAYVASHDLKEPLRMVTGFMQLLVDRYQNSLEETAREYIRFAVSGAQRMQNLIDDLLTYSRVSGRKLKERKPVDLNQITNQVLSIMENSIKEVQAQIIIEQLPTVRADNTHMLQLFQNLISNAIKFKSERPLQIKIQVKKNEQIRNEQNEQNKREQNKNEWQFAITDNGIGIKKEFFDKIFVIFQRLHSRDQYPGTGIGLAIVKKIVETYGGRIWVESNQGEGTTFFFTLPAD